MTPDELAAALVDPDGDFAAAYDGLVAANEAAVPALARALERGRGVPQLTAVLAALPLPDPVSSLQPLVDDMFDVHDAALRALGASGDPRALPILVDALELDPIVAADALARLGDASAVGPLRDRIRRYVGDGDQLPAPALLRTGAGCLDLRMVAAVITAVTRLGDRSLAAVALHLAGLRDPSEAPDAALVRTAAVRALYDLAAPGVAAALRAAAGDPDLDTARAALLGMLYLGRTAEAERCAAVAASGGPLAPHAVWWLAAWSGETIAPGASGRPSRRAIEAWWANAAPRFAPDVCYRLGEPIRIGRLIDELARDPRVLRPELELRTGARAVDALLTGNPVAPRERVALDAWWQANAARFVPGKLHRWGRTFEPGAVD